MASSYRLFSKIVIKALLQENSLVSIKTEENRSENLRTDQLGNKSYFDASGRLRKIENNQAVKSNNTITYTTDTGNLISTITDGAGRVYQFTYQSNLLHKISYSCCSSIFNFLIFPLTKSTLSHLQV